MSIMFCDAILYPALFRFVSSVLICPVVHVTFVYNLFYSNIIFCHMFWSFLSSLLPTALVNNAEAERDGIHHRTHKFADDSTKHEIKMGTSTG
jgi:hypothetical protein